MQIRVAHMNHFDHALKKEALDLFQNSENDKAFNSPHTIQKSYKFHLWLWPAKIQTHAQRTSLRNGKSGAERVKGKQEISCFCIMIFTKSEWYHCFWQKKNNMSYSENGV